MAWTAPKTWAIAELVTASQLNTHLRDNLLETAPGKVTTKGDSVWGTGANAIVRLGVGINGSPLVADSTETQGVKWAPNVIIDPDVGLITFPVGGGTSGTLPTDRPGIAQGNGSLLLGAEKSFVLTVDIDSNSAGASSFTIKEGSDLANPFFTITAAGLLTLKDSGNAFMTAGITVNQLLADDEVFAAKSSDVAHGITDAAETDTYFTIVKKDSANGGVRLDGYNEGSIGMFLVGNATTEETAAPSNSSIANVMVVSQLKSGTSTGLHGANAHLFAIRNFGTTRWVVDAEGDTYRDGTSNTFDKWDDVQLARAFDIEMAPNKVIRSQFDEFLQYGRDDLIRAGILTGAGSFYNESQLLRLVTGGLWQVSTHIEETTKELRGRLNQALDRIEILEQRLIA